MPPVSTTPATSSTWPDAPAAVREIRQVLRPGGTCLIALYHVYSLFHLYMVAVRGVLLGRLFRLGYAGLMATSEVGADGREDEAHVRLYSRKEAQALLAGFEIRRTSVHHPEIGRLRSSVAGRLATPLLRALAPHLGWYVVCEAVRPPDVIEAARGIEDT